MQSPFTSPFFLMAKPAGAACNLACRYCYYIDKNDTLSHSASSTMMSDRVLEAYVKAYIEAQPTDRVMFTWHGGEPLLRSRFFYERALQLQRRYAGGRHIDNSLQTNGTLLTDDWCRFFSDNGFLIGLSIDGPASVHDRYRLTPKGQPTSVGVMRAVEALNRHSVEWNAMAVVNDVNSRDPQGFYTFFRDTLGCRYLQFAPIVERLDPSGRQLAPFEPGGTIAPYSVDPVEWGRFLNTIFDTWVRSDVGSMFVQIFDTTLASWLGLPPGTCVFGDTCGHSPVMEHNGDLYTCDHFAYPSHRLGNILDTPLITMTLSQRLRTFGADKRDALPSRCQACDWLRLCHGECPKNRIIPTGEPLYP
ncbi:MAG: anaerobic sulfatase maturase, partial [Duncaniella sp.]|nr:anaerobic sulfatase maturase [Duncaniella sp.]